MAGDEEKLADGFWARVNHPVFGAFISSAIIWNWEILYCIFRGLGEPLYTISFVRMMFLNTSNLGNLVGWPAFLTLVFLGLSPVLHETYVKYKRWWNVFVRGLRPIPNFIYNKTFQKLEEDKLSLKDSVKKLEKEKEEEKKQCSENERLLEKRYEVLLTKKELLEGRRVHVQGVGEIDPDQFVDQYLNLRDNFEKLQRSVKQYQTQIENKDKEIEELREKVAYLS